MKARKKTWSSGDLRVAVNPELCGEIGGDIHAIKLYFRAEPLSKARSDVALALLQQAFGKKTSVGMLDVRRSKLFVPTREIANLDALLHGEAAALVGTGNDCQPPKKLGVDARAGTTVGGRCGLAAISREPSCRGI
jgi:hypothetical protein